MTPTPARRRRRALPAAVSAGTAALLVSAAGAPAGTFTWTGGDPSYGYWFQGDNWTPGGAPGAGDDAHFAAAVGRNIGSSTGYGGANDVTAVRSLTFDAGAAAFTITGQLPLTIGAGGITDAAAAAEAVDNPLRLGAAQTWTFNAATGAIAFPGGVATGGNALTLDAYGTQTLSGPITGTGSVTVGTTGTATVFDSGGGTLTLAGNSTYTGGTNLSAGTVVLGSATALGSTGPILFTGYEATLRYGPGVTADLSARLGVPTAASFTGGGVNVDTGGNNVTFATGITAAATLVKSGSGTLTVAGTDSFGLGYTVAGGTLAVAGTGGLGGGGVVNVYGGGTLALPATADPAAVSVAAQYVQVGGGGGGGGGTVAQSGGTVTVAAGDGIEVQAGGAYLVANNAVVNAAAAQTLPGTGPFPGTGPLSIPAGISVAGGAAATTALFQQSGGTVTAGYVSLGNLGVNGTGSTTVTAVPGLYVLTGGTLATANVYGGNDGSALALAAAPVGVLNLSGGTLLATASDAPTFPFVADLVVNVGRGGAVVNTGPYAVSIASPLLAGGTAAAPDGGLTKLGTGTLTLTAANTYAGPTVVRAGTLEVATTSTIPAALNAAGGSVLFDAATNAGLLHRSVGPVTATSVSVVGLASSATPFTRTLLTLPSLSVGPAATFDAGDNDLDVTNQSLAAITALAAVGYGNGIWNARGGLDSFAAAADPTSTTALGVVGNGQGAAGPLFSASHAFDGVAPGPTDVLVKYTYYGDANLDGVVDGADYARIDAGFLSKGTLTGWYNGDFNYDGKVNASDYTLIDNAFNEQGATLSPAVSPAVSPAGPVVAASTAEVAAAAAVPEPAAVGGVAVAASATALARRRLGRFVDGRRHRRG